MQPQDQPRFDSPSHSVPNRERITTLERELADCRQQRAEERQKQESLHLFLDCAQDYAFISLDVDGRVVAWSRGAERILGYTESEILGQPASVIFAPEDRAQRKPEQELALAHTEGRAEDERWHVRRDGSQFWASGVITAIRDTSGTLRGYGKVLRDMTESKQYEEQLRESEERFRLFVDNVTDYALFQVDPEGRVSAWNSGGERTFGYLSADILGHSLAVLLTPEDAGLVAEDLRRAATEGRAEFERWMVRRDGTRFWARWVTTPMRDRQAQLRGFAKVLRDETEHKRAEEDRRRLDELERERLQGQVQTTTQALDRTQEELRALAGSLITAQEDERRRIARDLHDDLGQQLAVLEIKLERLEQQQPLEAAQLDSHLKAIHGQVTELSRHVRLISHRLHPSVLEDLGLKPALRQLAGEFGQEHGAPVRFRSDAEVSPLPLSPATALYRIAQEALRNASKYAPGQPVVLELSQRGRDVYLTIEDEGPGFDPEAVRARGGLGTVSMQERVHLVGGSFQLTSALGKGTKITVSVPLPEGAE